MSDTLADVIEMSLNGSIDKGKFGPACRELLYQNYQFRSKKNKYQIKTMKKFLSFSKKMEKKSGETVSQVFYTFVEDCYHEAIKLDRIPNADEVDITSLLNEFIALPQKTKLENEDFTDYYIFGLYQTSQGYNTKIYYFYRAFKLDDPYGAYMLAKEYFNSNDRSIFPKAVSEISRGTINDNETFQENNFINKLVDIALKSKSKKADSLAFLLLKYTDDQNIINQLYTKTNLQFLQNDNLIEAIEQYLNEHIKSKISSNLLYHFGQKVEGQNCILAVKYYFMSIIKGNIHNDRINSIIDNVNAKIQQCIDSHCKDVTDFLQMIPEHLKPKNEQNSRDYFAIINSLYIDLNKIIKSRILCSLDIWECKFAKYQFAKYAWSQNNVSGLFRLLCKNFSSILDTIPNAKYLYACNELQKPNPPGITESYFKALADNGHSNSMYLYADMIYSKRPEEAKQYFFKAANAENPNPFACYQIGLLYIEGKLSFQTDWNKAEEYWGKEITDKCIIKSKLLNNPIFKTKSENLDMRFIRFKSNQGLKEALYRYSAYLLKINDYSLAGTYLAELFVKESQECSNNEKNGKSIFIKEPGILFQYETMLFLGQGVRKNQKKASDVNSFLAKYFDSKKNDSQFINEYRELISKFDLFQKKFMLNI